LGLSKEKKERLNLFVLMFSLNSISLLSHRNINETSMDCYSAIVFGSFKREKREIEFISFGGSEATPFDGLFQGGRFAPPKRKLFNLYNVS